MEEEKQVKKRKKIVIVTIVTMALLLVIVGVSYALWQQSKVQEGTNYIASGCFGVTFEGNNPINLTNSFPITEEEGMKTVPYTFTITSSCNSKAAYDVTLESLASTTFANSSIRVALDSTNKLYSEYEEAETYYNDSIESRRLISGRLDVGESVTYNLRLWIDEAVTIEEQNKIFASKIVINASEDFDDPVIENINATSTINSINITYNANGDISTTCKWGLTAGTYDNIVENATTTDCNITGLTDDTTYYYQICTETGRGTKCEEGNIKTILPISSQVELGDYISMTPTLSTYTITKNMTGYSSDQIIHPSELKLWRVIKINTDGTVEMVSHYTSGENIYFFGKEGYKRLVGTLDWIAVQYRNSEYIQSTRHIGYSSGTTSIINNETKLDRSSSAPWNSTTTSGWTPTTFNRTLIEETEGGDIGYTSDYQLVTSVYGSMKATMNNTDVGRDYWLASRSYNYSNGANWGFSDRYVTMNGTLNSKHMYGWSSGVVTLNGEGYSIRPILTLKSTCEVSGGSGGIYSPYILK